MVLQRLHRDIRLFLDGIGARSIQFLTLLGCLYVLVIFFAALALTGCGIPVDSNPSHSTHHDSNPKTNTLRVNLGTEPPSLDPAKVVDLTSFTVVQNIMRGLTTLGADMKAAPALATSWEVSEDGLTYLFHLNKKARWSDGVPVTTQHLLEGWHRVLTPETGADYAFFLFELKNGKRFYDNEISFDEVGAKALDLYTLQVQLERPIPFFLEILASPVALPFRKDVYEEVGDRFTEATHSVTNGPFVLSEWQHNVDIKLTPNPMYFGEQAQVDVLLMMVNDPNTSVVMYENNELDFIETTTSIPSFDVRRLQYHADATQLPIHRLNYIGFNTQLKPFNDSRVRQAFALAVDRSFFPKLLQSGQQPNASWLTPGLFGFNKDRGLHFDPKRARALLAEAGYPNGEGFPEVSLGYRTLYETQKEMEILQYLWKENLNVSVRLANMEWKMFLKQLQTEPPALYRLGWFVDYPDADSFMSLFTANSGNNYTGWHNADYDAWVTEAAITPNGPKRQRLLDSAQSCLLEEQTVIIPLYNSQKTILIKPWVSGLHVNALNLIQFDRVEILEH